MRKWSNVLKEAAMSFAGDNAPRLGAAIAYYTVFSIAPLILITITLTGAIFGEEAARGQVFAHMRGLIGDTGAEAVNEMVQDAARADGGAIAATLGTAALLLGAAGVFGQLRAALNTIFRVQPKDTPIVMGFLKERFLSVATVMVIGFLLLVALVVDTTISAAGDYTAERLRGGEGVWHVVELAVSTAMITVLFALIFRYMPDVRIPWREVWVGAIFTAVLFGIGKFALGLYLGKKATESTHSAAGALIILLLWVYYSAQILLLGAELTQAYARQAGSTRGEQEKQG
ncbi:MAG TPA: YihY/virulence factor BrkB family protein [Thermoanaerobaculia bacterium]|nr:YihY/virulence factor BrkB family protein [Thermoanaerobaculia bacterium]